MLNDTTVESFVGLMPVASVGDRHHAFTRDEKPVDSHWQSW